MNWLMMLTILTPFCFSSELAKMQQSLVYSSYFIDFESFFLVFLRSLKIYLSSLLFISLVDLLASISLRLSLKQTSAPSGLKKIQVKSKSSNALLSSICFLFLSNPQTTGKGECKKLRSMPGMILTTGEEQLKGLNKTCVKRQIQWVRICEFQQIKTTLSSSIISVNTSKKVSRVNILIIEKIHSFTKNVLASSQYVNRVIFFWSINLCQYSLLKFSFLYQSSWRQCWKSWVILQSWNSLSVCFIVSLMFQLLCLQTVSLYILTMFMKLRTIYQKKVKKGQQVIMQKTR